MAKTRKWVMVARKDRNCATCGKLLPAGRSAWQFRQAVGTDYYCWTCGKHHSLRDVHQSKTKA